MTVAVCKTSFPKSKPKEIVYKNYMKFDIDLFQGELKLKRQSINNYESFKSVFHSVRSKYAPLKKKLVRGNQAPYMAKQLPRATMRHFELESNYSILI